MKRRRRRDGDVAGQCRAAFREGVGDATFDLTHVAFTYQSWAQEFGSPAERAEAAWMLTVGTARESMRRRLPSDRERILASAQSAAAEAGLFGGLGGRAEEAVVALEHSRAVVLTRQLGYLDPRTRDLLLNRGGKALLDQYLAALRRRGDVLRSQYADRPDVAAGIRRGQAMAATGELSAFEQSQAELIRLTRMIQHLIGEQHFLDIAEFASIQSAAQHEPLLYLASAETEGYAVLVFATGRPTFHPLPGMTLEWLQRHGRIDVDPAQCVEDLASMLGGILSPLQATGIGVIPVGRLAGLPVHAAILLATARRPGGPLAPRYLPNARFAQTAPLQAPAGAATALFVGVRNAEGAPPLPHAESEARYLHARYGGTVAQAPTSSIVLNHLGGADLVHFICHGVSRADDPLSGGLLLQDGMLTVQTLMARPPQRRQLVLICACEAARAGGELPDEVIGLPAALMQAGAAAVISAQWRVDEVMAVLLFRRLHELLRQGWAPPTALARAQLWLSTATRGELQAVYPDLYEQSRPAVTTHLAMQRAANIPYRAARHWAAFTYTGQ